MQDLGVFFSNGLSLTNGIGFYLPIALFFVTMVGQAHVSVPLVMETTWLILGRQVSIDTTSIFDILILLCIAQVGRQAGINVVYEIIGRARIPLLGFYSKHMQNSKLFRRIMLSYQRVFKKKTTPCLNHYLSTMPATIGILTCMSIPVKLSLGLNKKRRVLLLSTLFSGLIYDGYYILMGSVSHMTSVNSYYLPLFFLGCLVLYIGIRQLLARAPFTRKQSLEANP